MTTFTNVSSIKVSPGIGMARVGNSQPASSADRSYFYLGPEEPNTTVQPPDGPYKDAMGRILRQAQRFRVFAYDASGGLLGEINDGDTVNGTVVEIRWTAHLANMKAANYCFQGQYGFNPDQYRNSQIAPNAPGTDPADRTSLIIDPGPISIAGVDQGPAELLGPGSTIFDVPRGDYELSGLLRFDPPQDAGPGDTVNVTYDPVTVSLGKLYTDDAGRLIVVGGEGAAGSCTTPAVVISKVTQEPPDPNPEYNGNSYFNNPGWYDDTAGGSIDAAVVDKSRPSTTLFTTEGNALATGWVGVSPPKYAPTAYNIVSLLDLQIDLFPDQDPYAGAPVNFYRDIYPLLKIATDYAWTSEFAYHGHRPGAQGDFLRQPFLDLLADPTENGADARNFVFNFIRPAAEVATPPVPPPPQKAPTNVTAKEVQRGDLMPRLTGNGGSVTENTVNKTNFPNQWLSLTNHQLAKIQSWVDGNFIPGTPGDSRWSNLPADQALDFAALQPTVGGGFHPGIELTYLMQEKSFFAGPFRFAAGTVPGSIAGYMSIPWQGDFWSCNTTFWPAARPDISIERDHSQTPPLLQPRPWFRGSTIPPYADSISNYNDGYQTMADDWPRYGFVVPVLGQTDQGEQVFEEIERDPTLDAPTVLAALTARFASTGDALAASSGTVVSATLDAASPAQQWVLVPTPVSPSFFLIASVGDGSKVLTAGGSSLTLAAQAVPHEDSQLWQYVPTNDSKRPGYPGAFFLESRFDGQVLTVTGTTVETAPEGSGSIQRFRLEAAT